jgi:hypothetical protein
MPAFPSREDAAPAGISDHQRKQAVRVANIPTEAFEAAIGRPKPATVTQLAEMGKKVHGVPETSSQGRGWFARRGGMSAPDYRTRRPRRPKRPSVRRGRSGFRRTGAKELVWQLAWFADAETRKFFLRSTALGGSLAS